MAETRKYDPAAGNAIAAALRAAMGEPVRPIEPGAGRPTAAPDQPDAPATTWVTITVDPPQTAR